MTLPIKVNPLPNPPGQYDPEYMVQLLQSIANYVRALNAPGPVAMTNFLATAMPGNGFGLPAGAMYHHFGVVKIVQPYDLFFPTLAARTAVGVVTTL